MRKSLPILATLLVLAAGPARATPDPRAEAEIQALLAFVERSGCAFVRSGTAYDGRAAREHLERKYGYARSMLGTADQFVEYVASGSSTTGEAYRVRCGTNEQTSRAWLRAELARMRAAPKGGARDVPRAQ